MLLELFLFIFTFTILGWNLHALWERSRIWRRYKKNQENHERAHRAARHMHPTNRDWPKDPAGNSLRKSKIYDVQKELWPEMAKLKENRKKWAYGAGPKFNPDSTVTPIQDTSFYRQMHIKRKRWGSPNGGQWFI